jgi:hypothetical protein
MAEVPLKGGGIVFVDDADLSLTEGRIWRFWKPSGRGTAYAVTGGGNRKILMHRLIVGAPAGVQVDHRDGNGLNNRRSNLRYGTNAQHRANSKLRSDNTSGYRGVTLHGSGLWLVRCANHFIGYAKTPEEGGRMYDAVAIEVFGEFARLNFPPERTRQ